MAWEERCKEKRAAQQARIPKEWLLPNPPLASQRNVLDVPKLSGILTPLDLEITELDDVDVLLAHLATGKWSSYTVTLAYCKRAMIAQQLTNCLTEFWIEDALSRARELDEALKSKGPVGPLHGLPVSLKDQFDVGGRENNMGLACWLGRISTEDAALVTVLKAAGAVMYVRTNVPMTIMATETINHVYGQTVNPRNRTLTTGGSSGGEGAILAMKGSPLGVGTDIGGSIRIPSMFNNVYGLRPTTRRLPYAGASNTQLGQESIESSLGPMSRSLSGCTTFVKAILDGQPWDLDPKVVEIKWREDMYQLDHMGGRDSKLCFGYFDYDEVVMPHPPVRRAIAMTIDVLCKAGHTVIPWKPIDHEYSMSILGRVFGSDSGEEYRELFKETQEPFYHGTDTYETSTPLTVNGTWKLNLEKEAYRKRYLRAWIATASVTGTGRPIDGLICPVSPYPPALHGTSNNKYVGYTCVYNVLDLPSVVLPVTIVDPAVDIPDTSYQPISELDASVHAMYDSPETFKDAPIGVQVVGRRWREEEVLGVASVVDEALRGIRGF